MLDSFELSRLLTDRGFERLSSADRTKAHGFEHESLHHPIYLKMSGGGKQGPLEPSPEAPLVIHPEAHTQLAASGLPAGVRLKSTAYKSAGLLKFKRPDGATPEGCDYWIEDSTALDGLLRALGLLQAEMPAPEQGVDPLLLQAAAADIDADPLSSQEPPSVRQALVNARIGQGEYRRQLLSLWGGRCALSGCAIPTVLIASHIRAWRDCTTTRERLDKFNGLLLAASIDRLFDAGYISFADDGRLLLLPAVAESELMLLGVEPSARLKRVMDEHRPYLASHRARHGF